MVMTETRTPRLPREIESHRKKVQKDVDELPIHTLRSLMGLNNVPVVEAKHKEFKKFVLRQQRVGAYFETWFEAWLGFLYYGQYDSDAEDPDDDH